MNKDIIEQIRSSKVWDREFEDCDDVLDNGILKCEFIPEDSKLILSIMRTSQLLEHIWEKALAKHDLSIPQFELMKMLYFSKKDFLTQEEISKKLFTSKANVSSLLSRMEHKDYISRAEDPQNKRSKQVKLTRKGLEKMFEVFSVYEEADIGKTNLFNKNESKELVGKFQKYREFLKAVEKKW